MSALAITLLSLAGMASALSRGSVPTAWVFLAAFLVGLSVSALS